MNNLKLMKTEIFENEIPCDFWVSVNGEYFITREQIGTALGYRNPSKAIEQIHYRHRDRLDKYSCVIKSEINRSLQFEGISSNGSIQERTFYSRKGIMEICRWSNKPLADKFMDWCWEVIDNLISNQVSMMPSNQVNVLTSLIDNISRQNRNLENKITRLENMISSLIPPKKYSEWKKRIGQKIREIAKQLGLETESEIRSIYGEIYNTMRNDYGLDVNNYKGDYLKNHTDAINPSAIDIVDDYEDLKSLFESIADNYMEIKTVVFNH